MWDSHCCRQTFRGDPLSKTVQDEITHHQKACAHLRKTSNRFFLLATLLFQSSIICCSACLIRRDLFEKIGGFDPGIPSHANIEMYLQGILQLGFHFVDKTLLNRRTGAASLINSETTNEKTALSYRLIYENYQAKFGKVEFLFLRLLAYSFNMLSKVPATQK